MKKAFITLTVLLATTMATSAQNVPARGQGTNKSCPTFVDANKDGICDNFRTGRGSGRGTGNCANFNNSKRQARGTGLRNPQGNRNNFVDANNNGVCDYLEGKK